MFAPYDHVEVYTISKGLRYDCDRIAGKTTAECHFSAHYRVLGRKEDLVLGIGVVAQQHGANEQTLHPRRKYTPSAHLPQNSKHSFELTPFRNLTTPLIHEDFDVYQKSRIFGPG
jgi:hypothetical protein